MGVDLEPRNPCGKRLRTSVFFFLRQGGHTSSLPRPPTLAQRLKAAFVSSMRNDKSSDVHAAIRAALETCNDTAALLEAELLSSSDAGQPPVKRRVVNGKAES